jgi:hypothetical protein
VKRRSGDAGGGAEDAGGAEKRCKRQEVQEVHEMRKVQEKGVQ